jgi:hypothetical protein
MSSSIHDPYIAWCKSQIFNLGSKMLSHFSELWRELNRCAESLVWFTSVDRQTKFFDRLMRLGFRLSLSFDARLLIFNGHFARWRYWPVYKSSRYLGVTRFEFFASKPHHKILYEHSPSLIDSRHDGVTSGHHPMMRKRNRSKISLTRGLVNGSANMSLVSHFTTSITPGFTCDQKW